MFRLSVDCSRRALKVVGALITVAAILFVGWEIAKTDISRWVIFQSWSGLAFLAILGLGYGLGLFLLLVAWILLIQHSVNRQNLPNLILIYGQFQIYKYIPTNVVHHASRYVSLLRLGLGHRDIVWSSAAELALALLVALFVGAAFGGAEAVRQVLSIPAEFVYGGGAVFITGATAGAYIIYLKRERGKAVIDYIRPRLKSAIAVIPLYFVFFIICGCLFWSLISESSGTQAPLAIIVAANGLAWILGTLTPGAPGGIGVREAVLIALLGPYGMTDGVIAAVAQFRLVTVLGDVFFYFAASGLNKLDTSGNA